MEQEFEHRSAIVTGGGNGIGRAIALDLADAGAAVHVVSRSQSAANVAEEIVRRGGRAHAYVGSVADQGFCRGVVEAAARLGGPDLLVNAAGVLGPGGPFTSISMSEFADTIAVNLLGSCNFMHAALPLMEAKAFGRIVNFAGGGAAYSYPNFTPYGTSKAALVRFTETLADEILAEDVTVNIIAPGAVETAMLVEVRSRGGEVRTTVAITEPVALVHFLCTEEARHISGRFIHVRDDYRRRDLYAQKEMLKLRRIEVR